MQQKGWITKVEYTTNITDFDVNVEEGAGRPRAVVSNEKYDDGLRLSIRLEDDSEIDRFLSRSDVSKMLSGDDSYVDALTPDVLKHFGVELEAREDPIMVAVFDASVDLDEVRTKVGRDPDALSGEEFGLLNIPDGRMK